MKFMGTLVVSGILLLTVGAVILILSELSTIISDGLTLSKISKTIFILLVTFVLG